MFDVASDAYGRFMGRFSEPLADEFVVTAGVRPGHRVLDVGCGPGALTARLVDVVGSADLVAAVDPSESFVDAARGRLPAVDVRVAGAADLPFPSGWFDVVAAQLVVHFLRPPEPGLREMARVTRPGGSVAACVWDHAAGAGPLEVFWRAVHDLDPGAPDESGLPGAREGHLAELMTAAGLVGAVPSSVAVTVRIPSFEDWWAPFLDGVGPAGAYVAAASHEQRQRLRARCAELLPDGPVEITARAWCAVAQVPAT